MDKNGNQVAVVLGGTVPHAELIRQLKDRGYRTVLIDYFDNPPAATFSDVHLKDSAMDFGAVLRIAKEYGADLVLSSCLDQQMNIAMKVSEELGLPHPFSSETARKVTDKKLMKKIMADNGIPTATYRLTDGLDIDITGLHFPLIVKPADSCGSAGITRLESDDPGELTNAIKLAASFGLTDSVVVEEYITGTEMGVHGYVKDGKAIILFGTCKISVMTRGISQQFCNVYVPNLRADLQEKLQSIADDIVKAFELPAYTPLFMQCIVRDDKVFVIEFSPRVAGGTTSEVARIYCGFDLVSYSIDSYTGEHLTSDGHALKKCVCCFPLYANDGIFDHITGAGEVCSDGTAHHIILLKSPGDHIDWSKPSSANVMKYVIDGNSFDDCYAKMKKADKHTDIINVDGESMRSEDLPDLTYNLYLEKISKLI